jgi:hypothetical protein
LWSWAAVRAFGQRRWWWRRWGEERVNDADGMRLVLVLELELARLAWGEVSRWAGWHAGWAAGSLPEYHRVHIAIAAAARPWRPWCRLI